MQSTVNLSKIRVSICGGQSVKNLMDKDARLLYMLEGSMDLDVESKKVTLKAEDVFIINSGYRYTYTTSADALFVSVPIIYELIGSRLGLIFNCDSTMIFSPRYDELRAVIKKILFRKVQEAKGADGLDFSQLSEYFTMVELLMAHFAVQRWSDVSKEVQKSEEYRKELIERYIFDNFMQPISLSDMAENLNLSEAYLSRMIKKIYGVGFAVILKNVRLAQAMDDLLYTDHSIIRIAYDNGFSNSSYFTRVFKEEYGKSPKEVRTEEISHREAVLPDEDAENRKMEAYFRKKEGKTESPAQTGDCLIDVSQDIAISPAWGQMINGGRAPALLRHEVQKNLLIMKKNLHFQYLRFWNLFDPEMHLKPVGKSKRHDFTHIDELIDFMVEAELKPFIVLQEKEKVTVKDSSYQDNRVVFSSVEQWEELLRALLHHWIERYGIDEVSDWKMEVWYDGIRVRGMEPMENFFRVFRSTWTITKELVSDLEIGGCGYWEEFTMDLEKRQRNFWQEWIRRAPEPDFLTIINYAYDEEPGVSYFTRRNPDPDFLLHSITRFRRELETVNWQYKKIVVSEWNLTVSDQNYINDSCFMGAYILRNMIRTINQIDTIGFYKCMDMNAEYYESRRFLSGGNGLLNANGIEKPSAIAVRFLNLLYPYMCGSGEQYLLTRNRKGSYRIVCHNMKELNYYYYGTEVQDLKKENVWKCFDDLSVLRYKMVLSNVENGRYRITVLKANEKYGSLLDSWKNADYCEDLNLKDISHLINTTAPKLGITFQTVKDNRMTLDLELEPNEIRYIKIDREY